jgi:hypothetical protein
MVSGYRQPTGMSNCSENDSPPPLGEGQGWWRFGQPALTPPYQGGEPALLLEHQDPVHSFLTIRAGGGEGART